MDELEAKILERNESQSIVVFGDFNSRMGNWRTLLLVDEGDSDEVEIQRKSADKMRSCTLAITL